MANLLERASVVLTATAYNNGEALCIKPDDASGDFQFSRATEATRINSLGLVETIGINLPRINYEGGCGSWLWEPQSTNLFDYSEDLGQSYWNAYGAEVTRTFDATVANPTGNLGAYSVEGVSSARRFGVIQTVTPSTDYTLSFYVKNIDATVLKTLITNSSVSSYTFTSQVNTTNWSRIEINFTSLTGTTCVFQITRDLPIGESAYFWGLMLEEQSFITSYIKTSGSTVTRNKDVCTNGGSLASINSTEGVLYFEGSTLVNGGSNRYISLSNNTSSNRLQVIFHNNSNRLSIGMANPIGSVGSINDFSFVQTNNNKVAVLYSALGLKLFVNGILRGSNTDNASFTPNTLTTLDFALWNQTTAPFEGNIKCLALFEALTDAELISLTTI